MAFSTLTVVLTPALAVALVAIAYGTYRLVMLLVAIFNATMDAIYFFRERVQRWIPGIVNPITKATLVFYYKLFYFLPLMTTESARICAISCNTLTGLFLLFHATLAIHNDVVVAFAIALGVHNTWWTWGRSDLPPLSSVLLVVTVIVHGWLEGLVFTGFFSLVLFVVTLAEKYRTIGYH